MRIKIKRWNKTKGERKIQTQTNEQREKNRNEC